MRIRYKVLFSFFLITIALIGSLYFVADAVLINSINISEETYCKINANRFLTNLDSELNGLDNNVNDWARWDDTYNFMINKSPQYIESNLLDNTYDTLNLNILLYFDTSKQLVFGKTYDLVNGTIKPLTDETLQQVIQYNGLFNDSLETNHGLILINNVPMLVSASPILTSDDEGPSHGTLIMGRYLNQQEIAKLSKSTGLPGFVSTIATSQNNPHFKSALNNLSLNSSIYAASLNTTQMAGYALLTDVQANPIAIAMVTDTRVQYIQGIGALNFLSLALIVIGIATFVTVTVLLERIVISRVAALDRTVTKIRKAEDNTKRVEVKGKDELSSLSENINGMLNVIENHTLTLEKTVQERTKTLSESQEKLQTILLASPDAIVAIDNEGKITEGNNRLYELTGFDRTSLLGKSIFDVIVDSQFPSRGKIISALESNSGVQSFETQLLRRDGTRPPAEVSVNIMRNEEGSTVGFVVVIRDLSERKMFEERLFKSERLAAIGELAGMVGHDLRNPLTAIRNAGYLLRKKCGKCREPHGIEMLDIIDKSITHSNEIVNDLLEYSREVHLDLTECTIKTLLSETFSMVKIPENVKLVDKTTDFKLKVDQIKVVRVIINIVKNSLEAMRDGGTLEILSRNENGQIYLEFKDTGVGISPETMAKLYTPLFTTKARGMGFGLSISRRIVEAHGGQILLKSIVGQGTTCTISFPESGRTVIAVKKDWIIDNDLHNSTLKSKDF